jgi:cell division protein ZipA
LDTSTLRWILVVIGAVILASIFLFWNPDRKRRPKASRRAENEARGRRASSAGLRLEPTLDSGEAAGVALGGDLGDAQGEAAGGQGELAIGEPSGQARAPAPKPRKPAGPPPEKIVSLYLLARDHHLITGADLLQATVSTGMEYGDMNIFHRVPEGTEQPVFSLANATRPGEFARDAWNTFETQGVVLFLTLPGPAYALDAWDSMLATARRVAEILHAELLDGERNPFTRQREAQIREELRDFDRRKSRRQ